MSSSTPHLVQAWRDSKGHTDARRPATLHQALDAAKNTGLTHVNLSTPGASERSPVPLLSCSTASTTGRISTSHNMIFAY